MMSENTEPELSVKSVAILSLGMIIASLGISLISSSGLGTTPISSLPFVASEVTGLTFGTTTFFFNFALIVLQLLLLRKHLSRLNWLQLPLAFSLYFLRLPWPMDVHVRLIAKERLFSKSLFFNVRKRHFRVRNCFGNPFSLHSFVWRSLCFGTVYRVKKTLFQHENSKRCTLVVLSCVLSYLALGYLFGVREGTILSALTVGLFVRFFAFLCSQFSSRK